MMRWFDVVTGDGAVEYKQLIAPSMQSYKDETETQL